ncbi:hypothetical protein D046_9115, partial [Vibrio parahaemolyticus V-223/04]
MPTADVPPGANNTRFNSPPQICVSFSAHSIA